MSEPAPYDTIEALRIANTPGAPDDGSAKATVFSAWGRLNVALVRNLPAGIRRAEQARRRIARLR